VDADRRQTFARKERETIVGRGEKKGDKRGRASATALRRADSEDSLKKEKCVRSDQRRGNFVGQGEVFTRPQGACGLLTALRGGGGLDRRMARKRNFFL